MKYTMTTPTKLLTTSIVLMWIHQANPCLALSHTLAVEKIIESINSINPDPIEEEHNMLQQDSEYFTKENTDFINLANILPNDYSNDENVTELHEDKNLEDKMHEDYPEFPAIENDEDYDYSEFENITIQDLAEDEEEDVYDDEKYEEFYGEYFPNEKRDKRDTAEVIDGIVESGEKLLSGNMVGSITTFLKTLAKPVFHYFIKSDNDNAMTKFTHRILPETGFRHSPNALMISKNAREGHGEKVWSTLADSSRTWNPRSNYKKDKFHQSEIHLECRRNIPIIDKNIVSRLKSVSLMVTSLMTSLHDTTITDINHGFKEASQHFKSITESTRKILNATINNPDTEVILIMLKDAAMTMDFVMEILANDTTEKMGLAVGGFVILLIILLTGILIKLIRDVKLDIKDLREEMEEIKKQVKPEVPSATPEQEMRVAVVTAVTEAMQTSIGQILGQLQARPSVPALPPTGLGAGLQAGVQYHGNPVALRSNAGGTPALY